MAVDEHHRGRSRQAPSRAICSHENFATNISHETTPQHAHSMLMPCTRRACTLAPCMCRSGCVAGRRCCCGHVRRGRTSLRCSRRWTRRTRLALYLVWLYLVWLHYGCSYLPWLDEDRAGRQPEPLRSLGHPPLGVRQYRRTCSSLATAQCSLPTVLPARRSTAGR